MNNKVRQLEKLALDLGDVLADHAESLRREPLIRKYVEEAQTAANRRYAQVSENQTPEQSLSPDVFE